MRILSETKAGVYLHFGGKISSVAHCAHTSLFIYIYTDYENLKFHF
jgi:hypothetical protein